MRNLLLSCAILLLFESSCTLHKKRKYEHIRVEEGARIEKCIKPWSYVNLTNERYEIKILNYYSKRVNGETTRPNFIIGVNAAGDTVGILDKYYSSQLLRNETVVVVGGDWENNDQIFDYARYQYSLNPKDNDLLCKVEIVFRGRILFKKD